MNQIPLKEAVNEVTRCESLTTEQLAGLRGQPPSRSRPKRYWPAVAALLLLAFSAFWWFDGHLQQQIQRDIADEVAYNHLAAKPLDILTADPLALDHALADVGVQLIKNASVVPLATRLLGARHCSIQSIPAAQLRYQRRDGHYTTVYQARYDADRHGRLPHSAASALHLQARGIAITLWRDRGVIIAIAKSPD